jgi:hypothetical protein
MTHENTPSTRPTLWLALGAVLAVAAIAILWPLQQVGQVCVMIYPAPPGCGADEPRWVPLVAIALVVALLAAEVVLYFTVARPRVPIVLLSAGMIAVIVLAAGIVALSQTGIWDPHQPPVIID